MVALKVILKRPGTLTAKVKPVVDRSRYIVEKDQKPNAELFPGVVLVVPNSSNGSNAAIDLIASGCAQDVPIVRILGLDESGHAIVNLFVKGELVHKIREQLFPEAENGRAHQEATNQIQTVLRKAIKTCGVYTVTEDFSRLEIHQGSLSIDGVPFDLPDGTWIVGRHRSLGSGIADVAEKLAYGWSHILRYPDPVLKLAPSEQALLDDFLSGQSFKDLHARTYTKSKTTLEYESQMGYIQAPVRKELLCRGLWSEAFEIQRFEKELREEQALRNRRITEAWKRSSKETDEWQQKQAELKKQKEEALRAEALEKRSRYLAWNL